MDVGGLLGMDGCRTGKGTHLVPSPLVLGVGLGECSERQTGGAYYFYITEVVLPFSWRQLLSDEVGQGLPLHLLRRRLSRLRDIGVRVRLILVCG